jgi:hypothetical protein
MRTIALETFKIINKKKPLFIQDLVIIKNNSYNFRYALNKNSTCIYKQKQKAVANIPSVRQHWLDTAWTACTFLSSTPQLSREALATWIAVCDCQQYFYLHACIEWFLVYELCFILLFCVLIFFSISFWFILMFFQTANQ